MAANCEKLKVVLTGYDCLDIKYALDLWIKSGVTKKTEQKLKSLSDRVYHQYNNTKRENA